MSMMANLRAELGCRWVQCIYVVLIRTQLYEVVTCFAVYEEQLGYDYLTHGNAMPASTWQSRGAYSTVEVGTVTASTESRLVSSDDEEPALFRPKTISETGPSSDVCMTVRFISRRWSTTRVDRQECNTLCMLRKPNR